MGTVVGTNRSPNPSRPYTTFDVDNTVRNGLRETINTGNSGTTHVVSGLVRIQTTVAMHATIGPNSTGSPADPATNYHLLTAAGAINIINFPKPARIRFRNVSGSNGDVIIAPEGF